MWIAADIIKGLLHRAETKNAVDVRKRLSSAGSFVTDILSVTEIEAPASPLGKQGDAGVLRLYGRSKKVRMN